MKRIIKHIFLILYILSFQNCYDEEKKESFKGYDLDYIIPYRGKYNFGKNTFRSIINKTYSNYLAEKERKKIIKKFFIYHMNTKNGNINIFESITVPSFDNEIILYRNKKEYFDAIVGSPISSNKELFIGKNKSEIIKFNKFIDSMIVSKPIFKKLEDTIKIIQNKRGLFIL